MAQQQSACPAKAKSSVQIPVPQKKKKKAAYKGNSRQQSF
jgi:hypothetical protein